MSHGLNPLKFLQHLAARLGLLGFLSGQIAADKIFGLGNQMLLIIVSALLRLATDFALDQICRIVSGIA